MAKQLKIPLRYKFERVMDKDKVSDIIRHNVIISKNRLWATNGYVLVSIFSDDIPREAVGRLLSIEHLKYARGLAKDKKEKFLSFEFKKENVVFSDGVNMPYPKNENDDFISKKVVLDFVEQMTEVVLKIKQKGAVEIGCLFVNPQYLFWLLEAMGFTFKSVYDEANSFLVKFYIAKANVGENFKAILINTIFISLNKSVIDEKEKNILRNIGVMVPLIADKK